MTKLQLLIHAAILSGESSLLESAPYDEEAKATLEEAATQLQEEWLRTTPPACRVRHMIDLLHYQPDRDCAAEMYARSCQVGDQ